MQASPDDIDVSALMSSVRRGLPRLLAITGLAGALTYGTLMLVPASYKSTAQIILQSSSSSLLRPSGEVGTGNDLKIDENEVASQAEVIRSRDLLSEVVGQLNLAGVPEFNPALQPAGLFGPIAALINGPLVGRDANERALTVLSQAVKVGEVPKTRLINVDVTSHDAKRSAEIANAVAQAYLDRNRSTQVQDASEASTSIAASIADVKKEAEAAEAELEHFRAESGLLSGQNKITLNNQQLSELNTQLTLATSSRTEAEARSKILRRMIASGTVETSQDVVKSPNMQQLFQQKLRVERDLAELSATLLPGHPRMRQLAAELAVAKQRLSEEAKQVAVGIEDDLKVATAREVALQDSIAKLTAAAGKSSEAQAKLSSLEREVQSKRNTYDGLLQRLNEASSRRKNSAVSAMAQLNERAVAASIPDSPKRTQMSIFAMLGTLLFGLVWLIGRGLIGGGTPGKPFGRRASDKIAQTNSNSVWLTNSQQLAALAGQRSQKAHGNCILVTSEDPSLTPTSATIDLAVNLAKDPGDVVVIDLVSADAAPGLAELVRGTAAFEDVVHCEPGHLWHRIGSGLPGMAELDGHTENLSLVIEALTAIYRHILISADREDALALVAPLARLLRIGVVCAAQSPPAGLPPESGFLGYDIPGLAVVWLEHPETSEKSNTFGRRMARSNTVAA